MVDPVRIEPRTLVASLGAWASGPAPLYRSLAEAIGAVIEAGDLPAGARLPPERVLADALPASRGTVVAALGLLAEQGLVVRRQGSGTTVRPTSAPAARRHELAAGLRAQSLTGRALDAGRLPVDLALSVIDDLDGIPAEAFDVAPETLASAAAGHGYAPLGIPALRDRLAELLTERVCPTSVEEVAVTLGVQHGITLAAEALTSPGDVVAIEDPTYPGAIDAYSRAGLRFAPLDADGGGTVPSSLRRALDGRAGVDGLPTLVHLSPVCASPTGVRTTAARRVELGDLLDGSGAWLVEDVALEHLVEPDGVAHLSARRPDRSILLASASKVAWGGLRVGWLRAPAPVVERIGRLRAAHDLGSPVGPQVVALRLLEDLDGLATRRRSTASARRRHLADLIARELPEIGCPEPDGGLSLWLTVPRAGEVVVEAARSGLDVVSGPVCSVGGHHDDHIRISCWAPPEVLDAAVERLAAAYRSVHADPPGA